ncbi:MAG: DUF2062 domain-containing protein [Candidatus Omnitrophota bacterium]
MAFAERIKRWLRIICHKLFEINDTPHRKALGLGLGVFLGIFPGAGPIAALTAAFVFRANRAAALLGSILTNTWLSVAVFASAVKMGSFLNKQDAQFITSEWNKLLGDFSWDKLTQKPFLDAAFAVFLGFFLISFTLGLIVYGCSLFFFIKHQKFQQKDKLCKG